MISKKYEVRNKNYGESYWIKKKPEQYVLAHNSYHITHNS